MTWTNDKGNSRAARATPTPEAATSGRVASKVAIAPLKPEAVCSTVALPKMLSKGMRASTSEIAAVSLHEYGGEVVGANRGMIEYDDLLKRPLEHYKYLLGTVETGIARMNHFLLHLDSILIASVGQISVHVPHPVHFSVVTMNCI